MKPTTTKQKYASASSGNTTLIQSTLKSYMKQQERRQQILASVIAESSSSHQPAAAAQRRPQSSKKSTTGHEVSHSSSVRSTQKSSNKIVTSSSRPQSAIAATKQKALSSSSKKENIPLSLLNQNFVDHDYFPSKKYFDASASDSLNTPQSINADQDSDPTSQRPHSAPAKSRKWKLTDFVLGKQLGKGKFGVVYVAFEKKSKKTVALKILDKRRMKIDKCSSLVKREIKIQSQLVHPNVLKLYGYFTDSTKVYLILEYCPKGEVYRQLKRSKRFSEKRTSKYIHDVAQALQYCHEKAIIHRDLKPENLLIGQQGLKLCDFGWSIQTENGQRRSTMCGTLDYLAPEMVEKRLHDTKLDLWCLGVLAYEFLCGKAPFHSRSSQETFRKISRVELKFPSHVSEEAKSLIRQLLKRSRGDRMPLSRVLKHPFISKYNSVSATEESTTVESAAIVEDSEEDDTQSTYSTKSKSGRSSNSSTTSTIMSSASSNSGGSTARQRKTAKRILSTKEPQNLNKCKTARGARSANNSGSGPIRRPASSRLRPHSSASNRMAANAYSQQIRQENAAAIRNKLEQAYRPATAEAAYRSMMLRSGKTGETRCVGGNKRLTRSTRMTAARA